MAPPWPDTPNGSPDAFHISFGAAMALLSRRLGQPRNVVETLHWLDDACERNAIPAHHCLVETPHHGCAAYNGKCMDNVCHGLILPKIESSTTKAVVAENRVSFEAQVLLRQPPARGGSASGGRRIRNSRAKITWSATEKDTATPNGPLLSSGQLYWIEKINAWICFRKSCQNGCCA